MRVIVAPVPGGYDPPPVGQRGDRRPFVRGASAGWERSTPQHRPRRQTATIHNRLSPVVCPRRCSIRIRKVATGSARTLQKRHAEHHLKPIAARSIQPIGGHSDNSTCTQSTRQPDTGNGRGSAGKVFAGGDAQFAQQPDRIAIRLAHTTTHSSWSKDRAGLNVQWRRLPKSI